MSTSDNSTNRSGDDRAEEFFKLFAGGQSRVFAYILALLPHWADAEEVFQETCIALWKDFDRFEPGTDFVRWATRVAYYRVLSFRKQRKSELWQLSDNFIACVAEEVEQRSEALEDRLAALAGCVERLAQQDKELLNQRYGKGQTARGLAAELGRPEDTVYKALARIRRTLLECVNRTLAAQERG